nr:3-deoxy-manno-octulosonate cytidylyltransferase [Gammaproteobacteria bacterium]
HERASDRAAEAMVQIEEVTGEKVDILVMVQGDEPMDTPEMITEALTPMMHDEAVHVVNLMGRIDNVKEFEDPNNVKVVVGPDSNAIYFSREPVPSRKKSIEDVPMLKQICVIPFRRDYLLEFNKTPETPLERIESVDMLRVIESGGGVRMVMTEYPSVSVDTPQDLEAVKELMTGDPLMRKYLS